VSKPRRRTSIFDLGDALLNATEDMLGGTGLGSRRMLEDMDAGALLDLLGDDRQERLATIQKLMKNSSAEDIAELVLLLTQAVGNLPATPPAAVSDESASP
jgi:hypothetical protein